MYHIGSVYAPSCQEPSIDERLDHPMTVPNVYGFDSRLPLKSKKQSIHEMLLATFACVGTVYNARISRTIQVNFTPHSYLWIIFKKLLFP